MKQESEMIVLGSRSPQRLELLRLVVPDEQIQVLPPESIDEACFTGLHDWTHIEQRLLEVAHRKCNDVLSQIESRQPTDWRNRIAAVIAGDTVIVVDDGEGRQTVLGQPPDDDSWPDVVRMWFQNYYFDRTHTAATALVVATPAGNRVERVVKSCVTFCEAGAGLLEWYIATGEPRGKAGGYALQGAGGIFVSRVEGSLSNVVGLPLGDLLSALHQLGIDVAAPHN